MKINRKTLSRSAYALLLVLFMTAVAAIILGGTLARTYGVARMNSRAVDMMNSQNAAEAAMEMVFSRMQFDFQSGGGLGQVINNLGTYRGLVPTSTQDSYWANFTFSDGQGHANKTYVQKIATYTGPLPISYSNRTTSMAPIYRIVSNAKPVNGMSGATGTAQEDVMLALIPLTAYAIFYNGLLEFSTCATMTVNGAVHSNTNIYVGTDSHLTFNTTVTSSGYVEAPDNNGGSWKTGSATNYNSSWNTSFSSSPKFTDGLATIQIALPMTNTHSLIEISATNDASTVSGQQRLYNEAQVVLTVSNLDAANIIVGIKVQKAPTSADVPGADASPTINLYTNPTPAFLSSTLPFLSITNLFYDRRENTTNITTQIDVGRYKQWLINGTGPVVGKFPADGSGGYPTILFVNDTRNTALNGGNKMDVVRLTNGISPPSNGGAGFSVATPNPLYVWGDYNQTDSSKLGKADTSTGTVPCALMSDALTLLSSHWSDNTSLTTGYTASGSTWSANADTVNAAILTGIVPSTGTTSTTFSGGVHNLPRLLEDWGGVQLTINTSIINLYNSTIATHQFKNPGTYYTPPTRLFAYDLNFSDPTKVPPGIPCALVALRYSWATPPPNTVNYNVTP